MDCYRMRELLDGAALPQGPRRGRLAVQ
jgi:hypothetical protein